MMYIIIRYYWIENINDCVEKDNYIGDIEDSQNQNRND